MCKITLFFIKTKVFPHFFQHTVLVSPFFLSSLHIWPSLYFICLPKPLNLSLTAKMLSFGVSHSWLTLFSLSFISSSLFFTRFVRLLLFSSALINPYHLSRWQWCKHVYFPILFQCIPIFKTIMLVFLSNCQGLSNNRCATCKRTTLHKISSL